jgi:hypothetical protein
MSYLLIFLVNSVLRFILLKLHCDAAVQNLGSKQLNEFANNVLKCFPENSACNFSNIVGYRCNQSRIQARSNLVTTMTHTDKR